MSIGMVDKNPIGFDMAVPTVFLWTNERMIVMLSIKGVSFGKFFHHGLEFFTVLSPFMHPLDVLSELDRK
jgi:hypothetical protein